MNCGNFSGAYESALLNTHHMGLRIPIMVLYYPYNDREFSYEYTNDDKLIADFEMMVLKELGVKL